MLIYGNDNKRVRLLYTSCFHCFSAAVHLVGNFSEGGPVYGVGAIGDNVYVIHESRSSIEVFSGHRNGFKLKHLINVTGMNGPYDMVLSTRDSSAFVVDWFDANNTFQIKLRPVNLVNKWSFNPGTYTSVGLSMSQPQQRILVTESQTNKIKEFSLSGSLLGSVLLQNITSPRQAVKISAHLYAVCFGYAATEKHQVCLVDGSGATLECFGGSPGNSATQLDVPARLFLRSDGSILVADSKNRRVLKLGSPLSGPAQVIVSASHGLSAPYRLFVDEGRHLLYVADNTLDPVTGYVTTGRILVYKI